MAQIPVKTSRPRQLTSKQTGSARGSTVRDRLLSKGLHFITANARERGDEIDSIMRGGNTTVFIEVHYQHSTQFGGATASATRSKRHKLLQIARLWLACHNGSFDTADCRSDMLVFTKNDAEWFKDAFSNHLQLRIQSLALKDQRVRQD